MLNYPISAVNFRRVMVAFVVILVLAIAVPLLLKSRVSSVSASEDAQVLRANLISEAVATASIKGSRAWIEVPNGVTAREVAVIELLAEFEHENPDLLVTDWKTRTRAHGGGNSSDETIEGVWVEFKRK